MNLTSTGKLRLFAVAIANHCLWSTLAISSRYLQVFASPHTFNGMAVLGVAKAMSAVLLILGSSVTSCCCEPTRTHSSSGLQHGTTKTAVPTASSRTRLFYALLFGSVAVCRACLNTVSTKFTLSYNINTINSLTPLVISIADTLILKTKLNRFLWPAILVSTLGCILIALAQSPLFVATETGTSNNPASFTHKDAIGCALQFASMLFSAVARLLMKHTEDILTRDEMVQSNNLFNVVIPILYTLIAPDARHQWKAFAEASMESIISLVSIGVLVYTIAATGQMSLVRTMGAGFYSSFSAVRVLGSVFLSGLVLGEPVQNWLEWLGLLVTAVTMTLYTAALAVSTHHPEETDDDDDDRTTRADDEEDQMISMSSARNWKLVPTTSSLDDVGDPTSSTVEDDDEEELGS